MKPTECAKILPMLADYTVGGLDVSTAGHVREHLAECADCRRELEALERTAALLTPISQVEPPRQLWAGIEQQLEPRRTGRPAWSVYLRPAVAVATVAAVLIAFSVFVPIGTTPILSSGDLPLLAGAEGTDYAETQIAAAWDQPLADEVSLALAMAALEPVAPEEVPQ